MNANKKTTGWILCPSKTYPGKFYYFNVSTGETAWGLGDAEVKKFKNDGLPKVPVNHCHPEPSGPPIDNPVKPEVVVSRPFQPLHHSTPIFGQPAFTKVPSKSEEANIIWTPIHIEVPIVLADKNQVKEKIEIDKEVLVQSCDKPLCQRFMNYEQPVIKFNKDNKIESNIGLDKIFTSTPIKSHNEPMKSNPGFETKTDLGFGDVFQSKSSISFSDLSFKMTNQKQLVRKPMFNIEVPSMIKKVNQDPHERVIEHSIKNPTFKITKDVVQSRSYPKNIDISPKIANQRCSSEESNFVAEKIPEKKPEEPKLVRNILQSKSCFSFLDLSSKIETQSKLTDPEITKNPEKKLDNDTFQLKSILIYPENAKIKHKWMTNYGSTTLEKVESVASDSRPNSNGDKDDIIMTNLSDKNLNGNDLRKLLVAKRRKAMAEDKTGKSINPGNSSNPGKTSMHETPKKRVRFNPDVIVENISFNGDDDDEISSINAQLASTVQIIRNLASFGTRDDQWCVIVDTETLLNEFTFIEAFVQIDPKCKLLVPARVVTEISSVSIGHGDRARVMVARNVIRRLPSGYIILQSSDDEVAASTIDCILQCCVDALDQNLHVILIANDVELIINAKQNSIICYSIQEIKDGVIEKPLQFESPVYEIKEPLFKQMEITVPNTEIKNTSSEYGLKKNLILETDDDLNEKEKEIIRNLVENSQYSNNSIDNEKLANQNTSPVDTDDEYSELSKLFSMNFNEKSVSDDSKKFAMTTDGKFIISNELAVENNRNSKISNRFSMTSNEKRTIANDYYDPYNNNSKFSDPYAKNSKPNFAIPNGYSNDDNPEVSNSYLTDENSNVNTQRARKSNYHKENSVFSRKYEIVNNIPVDLEEKSNDASWIPNNSKEWTGDVEENSIEECMKNLNIKDKPLCRFAINKTPEKNETENDNEELEETVSYYFQNQTPKFDMQNAETSNNYIRNSDSFQNIIRNVKSPKNETRTVSYYFKNEIKNQNDTKTPKLFEKEVQRRTFEINNTSKLFEYNPKAAQNSNFELHKSDTESSFSKFSDHEKENHKRNEKTKALEIRNLENVIIPACFPFKEDQHTKKFGKQPEITKQKTKEFEIRTLEKIHIPASSPIKNDEQTKKFKIPKHQTKELTPAKFSFRTDSNFENHPNARDNLQIEVRTSETGSTFKNDKQKVLPVNGIQNSVDLTKFYVKNKVMENRLNERMDEWICSFKQIMEEFLTSVLEELPASVVKPTLPPWTLIEALKCIRNIYKDHAKVKTIVDLMSGLLYETAYKRDKLKQTLTPNEFMKAMGCGIHLMKYLKNILQHSDESHSECHLMTIVEEIEDPMTENSESLVKTPTVLENKEIPRHNFVKNRSDIISYLKNHFPEWKRFDEEKSKLSDLKILRTVGKDLNKFQLKRGDFNTEPKVVNKINVDLRKGERIVETETQLERDKAFLENIKTKHTVDIDNAKIKLFKQAEDFENTKLAMKKRYENAKTRNFEKSRNVQDLDNHKDRRNLMDVVEKTPNFKMNTKILGSKITIPNDFKSQNSEYFEIDSKNGYIELNNNSDEVENLQNGHANSPKIIRNINVLEKYEKIYNKTSNSDELDYCSMQDSYFEDNGVRAKTKIHCLIHNDETKSDVTYCDSKTGLQHTKAAKTTAFEHYKSGLDDDSGLGYESPQAYTAVTSFSAELQCSLDMIHGFMNGSIQEIRDGKIRDRTKKMFRLKAFEANYLVTKVIVKLKKLAVKEAKNGSTGLNETETGDRRVSKNAKAVAECLEKLLTLHKTLNAMLSATSEDDYISLKSENASLSINLSS